MKALELTIALFALSLAGVSTAAAQGSGYLGIAIGCSDCGMRLEQGKWSWLFSSPPTVEALEASGPAARSGMRVGDALIAVDGLALTSPAGARRFADVAPGQTAVLTFRRQGVTNTATVIATRRPAAVPDQPSIAGAEAPPALSGRGPRADSPVRFSGGVSGLSVEVRGSPDVTVLMDERECGAVILTPTHRISLAPPGGCPGR